MSRRRKLIAFAPALVLVGLTAMIASGVSIIPGATAANTVAVGGTVTAGMSVPSDTSSALCGSGSLSVGDFTDGTYHPAGGNCRLTFATNGTNGASLAMRDNDGTAPAFCTGTCIAGTPNSLGTPSGADNTPNALGNDEFGAALVGVGGTPGPTALPVTGEFALDGTPTAAESIWGPIGNTDETVCTTGGPNVTDSTCDILFAVDGRDGNTQQAGTYSATVRLEATANP